MRIQRWPRRRIEDVRWIAQATSTLIHFRIILRVLYSLPYTHVPQVFDGGIRSRHPSEYEIVEKYRSPHYDFSKKQRKLAFLFFKNNL